MANNPYLEDNPYLNGYNFEEEENTNKQSFTSAPQQSNANNSSYANTQSQNAYSNYNNSYQPQTNNSYANSYNNRSTTNNKKEFDILDASTFVNADPKVNKHEGEPYKEIKKKNDKPKQIKIKERKRFSFKSFLLGIILAVAVMVTSLGFTIVTLYNTITLGKVQTWLNTDIIDGDLNDYTVKDLIGLFQDYNSLTLGNIEKLLGFDINDLSDEIAVKDLLDELCSTYLNKSYKQLKISELSSAVNTVVNDLTVDHFASILCETKENGDLKYFKRAILSSDICETLIACYTGKNIKLATFFGEDFGRNINYISIGTMVNKVFKTDENSSEFEKFIYNAFNDSQYGFYDLLKNYNDVLDNAIQIKDIVNSFIAEDTTDAILKIIRQSYGENTMGITSFIEDFSAGLNEIKLSTIVKCLWPDLEDKETASNYDGFIKLVYDIYSDPKNEIGVMDFANNISAQLNYIKVSNVIDSFFNGNSKIEEFIRNVYGDYEGVGLGQFIDEFMSNYINEITIKNVIETFLDSNNKFVNFLTKIYTDEKYADIGISEFIDGFIENYSKDIKVYKVVEFLVPENINERTKFENLLVDLVDYIEGPIQDEASKTDILTAFSDIKGYLNKVEIKVFTDKLFANEIITEKLKNLIYYSIHDEHGFLLEQFEKMGAYTYLTNITDFINNITLQEILDNTQNLPPLAEKIVKLFGKEGVLDFVEKPLDYINNLTIRTISRLYFDTKEGAVNTDKFPDDLDINIPSKFEEILQIEVQKEEPIQTMGDTTLSKFLKDREYYLDKITVSHLLEYLKENNSLAGLNDNTYTFLINHLGEYGLIYFKNNAAKCIQTIKVGDLIETLEAIGSFKGLEKSKKMYLVNFVKQEFSDLEIKDFVENFSTHLNSTTIEDLLEIIHNSNAIEKDPNGDYKNKTHKVLFGTIEYINNSLRRKNATLFGEFLTTELGKNNITLQLEECNELINAYKNNSIEELDFIIANDSLREQVLIIQDKFNKRENSPLRLNDYLLNAYSNITGLTIEDFCNIFEVKLEAEEGKVLSIYGKLLNQIKEKTFSEFLQDSETLLKDALTTVVNESTIGEINEAFNIDLTRLFKGYSASTKITDLFGEIDKLTIGDMVGETNSALLEKFKDIKLVNIADYDLGVEGAIDSLVLGDLVDINKTIRYFSIYPETEKVYEDLANYFNGKYIETGSDTYKYFTYNSSTKTFEHYNTTPQENIIKMTSINGTTTEQIINGIRTNIKIYNTINLDRFYVYDELEGVIQIKSGDERIETADSSGMLETVNSLEGIAFNTEKVYKIAGTKTFSYQFGLDSEVWSYVESPDLNNKTTDYTYNAYDFIIDFVKSNELNKDSSEYINILPQDTIKINSFYLEYNSNSKTFVLNENYQDSAKFLTILKHTKIKDIGETINNLTVGELFGEYSKIVKLVGNKTNIKIDEIDDNINISNLTLQELGDLELLDITNINSTHLNKTLQNIIEEFLQS